MTEVYSVAILLHKVLVEQALNDYYCVDIPTIFIWEHILSLIHERKYECTNLHHSIVSLNISVIATEFHYQLNTQRYDVYYILILEALCIL